jgi:hypothetical protein
MSVYCVLVAVCILCHRERSGIATLEVVVPGSRRSPHPLVINELYPWRFLLFPSLCHRILTSVTELPDWCFRNTIASRRRPRARSRNPRHSARNWSGERHSPGPRRPSLFDIVVPIFSANDSRKPIVSDNTSAPRIHVAVRRQRFADAPPAHQTRLQLHNRLHASPSVDQLQRGDTQAMHQNTEHHEKVHHRPHCPE